MKHKDSASREKNKINLFIFSSETQQITQIIEEIKGFYNNQEEKS